MSTFHQAENPLYLTVATTAGQTDQVAVGTATNAASDGGFYLRNSLAWAIEWEIDGTNDVSCDAKLQMESSDGTWIDAYSGDTASGSAASDIFTAEATLARGWTALAPPYSTGRFRILCDNNSGSNAITFHFWVHFTRDKVL